jgi:NTE family protein
MSQEKGATTVTPPRDENETKRIAIGCQGSGAITAFGAGALKRLLREEQHNIIGLSGTSGGAICALLTWYALLENDKEEAINKAAQLLDSFWKDLSASERFAGFLNDWTVLASRLQGNVAMLEVSPYYTQLSRRAREQLRKTLKNQPVDFENLWERVGSSSPVLLVSAIDVATGSARTFDSRNGEISIDVLLASAAVPPLFRAMHLEGGVYWDALFCQNPPVRELARMKPDEIWIIRVIPWSRGGEPKAIAEMMDRRNELSGNIALYQDLYLIEKINELVDELGEGQNKEDKRLRLSGKGAEYRHIEVREITMSDKMYQSLDFATKMDRSPSFIRKLMDHGEERADEFLGGSIRSAGYS